MDTSGNSTDKAEKWLMAGACAAGLILPLGYMLGGFSDEAFSWMTAALLLLLVMAGGVMGTGAVLRVSPAVLSEWPPPLLAGLGFLLGAVIVVVGAIRLFFRVLLCVANLLGAWPH